MLWFAQSWLELLVDVSIKACLLAFCAAEILAVTRVRNGKARHRAWTAVLLGMLALPVLVPVTPTVPLPAWILPDWLTRAKANLPAAPSDEVSREIFAGDDVTTRAPILPVVSSFLDGPVTADLPRIESDDLGSQSTIVESYPSRLEQKPTAMTSMRYWPIALVGIYIVVAAGFGIRIVLGMILAQRLTSRSRRIEEITSQLPDLAYPVFDNTALSVPLTVGFIRPKILLPPTWHRWSDAKLHAVVAHESAHIRRGEYLVTLLSEFNRAFYWFHPLAWWLRNWLSELAEQSCDDAVIAATGKPTEYARHLMEVASTLREKQGRVVWSGVSMARKANVETRIDAILDAKRPLAHLIGFFGGLMLVAVAVPAELLAAALRPGETPSDTQNESNSTEVPVADSARQDKESSDNESNQPKGPQELTEGVTAPTGKTSSLLGATSVLTATKVKGRVLDPDGNGKPGAIQFTPGQENRSRRAKALSDN